MSVQCLFSISLYSVLCNCVLTPGEDSHELARLEAFTKSYQVRQRESTFLCPHPPVFLDFSPEPPLGRAGMKEMEQDVSHPGLSLPQPA